MINFVGCDNGIVLIQGNTLNFILKIHSESARGKIIWCLGFVLKYSSKTNKKVCGGIDGGKIGKILIVTEAGCS